MTRTTPSKGYSEAWVIQSNSDPTATYIVSKRPDGVFACSCPAWKFHPKPKMDCKHCMAIKADLEIPQMANFVEAAPRPVRNLPSKTVRSATPVSLPVNQAPVETFTIRRKFRPELEEA